MTYKENDVILVHLYHLPSKLLKNKENMRYKGLFAPLVPHKVGHVSLVSVDRGRGTADKGWARIGWPSDKQVFLTSFRASFLRTNSEGGCLDDSYHSIQIWGFRNPRG
jgi:hypothetical protein